MLKNAGVLEEDEEKMRRSSRRRRSSESSSRNRRDSNTKRALLSVKKCICVFVFSQSKEIEITCTRDSLEQTLNYLDFLEAMCRLSVCASVSRDTRPMTLKLNDMWQRHIRGLLGFDTNEMYDRVISVMKEYVPSDGEGVKEEVVSDDEKKEIIIQKLRTKIESKLSTSKKWRACTRAIYAQETLYGSLIRSL